MGIPCLDPAIPLPLPPLQMEKGNRSSKKGMLQSKPIQLTLICSLTGEIKVAVKVPVAGLGAAGFFFCWKLAQLLICTTRPWWHAFGLVWLVIPPTLLKRMKPKSPVRAILLLLHLIIAYSLLPPRFLLPLVMFKGFIVSQRALAWPSGDREDLR